MINSSIVIDNNNVNNLNEHHFIICLSPLTNLSITLEKQYFISCSQTEINIIGNCDTTVIIYNKFHGDIRCGTLTIGESGKIIGNLNVQKLLIFDEAQFTGTTTLWQKN